MIGIFGVGVALAGLILTGKRDTDRRMDALAARMSAVEQRMAAMEQRMAAMEQRMAATEQRMARVEGLLEGLGLAGRAREATAAAAAAGD